MKQKTLSQLYLYQIIHSQSTTFWK